MPMSSTKTTRTQIVPALAVLPALLTVLPGAAVGSEPPARVAVESVSSAGLEVAIQRPFESARLVIRRIGGPVVHRGTYTSTPIPLFPRLSDEGEVLEDGAYVYELLVHHPSDDPERGSDPGRTRETGTAEPRGPAVVSDLFEIRDGRLVAKEETAAEAPGGSTAPADNALQPRDSVVTDDLIVEGSVCASDSDACADGEAFLTPLAVNAQLKLKDSSPVLWLNDTTSGHDDWVIRAETGTLRIQNADTGNDAIFIEEDAPDLSLYIEGSSAGGGIGFGTSNPTAHIHVVGGSPTIRLSEISKPEISVDLALKNPEELFVIRRSNNFESLFTIDLVTGRIGIGTGRPTAALDIAPRDGAADLRLASAGESWRFTNRGDVMTVSRDGSGAEELTIRDGLDAAGPTLVVEGSVQGTQVVNTSSRELKTSFEDLDEAAVLAKLAELPVTAWRYRHEPPGSRHIGPVAEDFQALFGLGDGETISTVDAVGVLMAAVQALHERVQELEGREPTGAAAPIGGE